MSIMNKDNIDDFYNPNNPWYLEHYVYKNDKINKEYNKIYEKYEEYFAKLPIVFLNDVINLQSKTKEPIKNKVLYSKLVNGDYQTKSSNSDTTNIKNTISFFRRNLPDFKKYEKVDDLLWVVTNYRLLLNNIMEWSAIHNNSILTIKTKLNAICRILYLTYGNKTNYVYSLYSSIIQIISIEQIKDKDGKNELTELEQTKFLPFEIIINKAYSLNVEFQNLPDKTTKKAYDLNQRLLLLALYTFIPPLCDEIKTLEYSLTEKHDKDYILLVNDDVILSLNLNKKRHPPIDFDIKKESKDLAIILQQSYILYPRISLFSTKQPNGSYKQKIISTLSQTLVKLFSKDYPNINIGTNSIRSSYYSYIVAYNISKGNAVSYNEKEEIAEKMRTSVKQLDLNYYKRYINIIPITNNFQNNIQNIDNNQKPKTNSYFKKLEHSKIYYKENKDKILQNQKIYKSKIPVPEQSRKRILRMLNNDTDYEKHIRPNTLKKYKFTKESDKWI